MRQTTFLKKEELEQGWRHVDADGKVLGRLASDIAVVLQGKHRPDYTPHIDCGDFVVVTNASKIKLTGRKAEQKMRKQYTGYTGGQKLEPWGSVRERRPEVLIEDAVRRMLPKGRLGRHMLKKLKVYSGAEHPHQAQQPVALETSA
ncbi:MAG: 50S ribosomal protein L13 [Planctomycetota bacterium]